VLNVRLRLPWACVSASCVWGTGEVADWGVDVVERHGRMGLTRTRKLAKRRQIGRIDRMGSQRRRKRGW